MKSVFFYFIVFIFITLVQCSRENKDHPIIQHALHKKLTEQPGFIKEVQIAIHLQPVNFKTHAWLQSINNNDSIRILMALNRADQEHLLRLDTLLIPEPFSSDINVYSPFPDRISSLNNILKLILISNEQQAFAVYEKGRLVKWGPASTGKKSTPTPTGLFHTNWKSRQTISTIDTTWIMNWYFNLINNDGISMHEYSLPGYPASHSCIRLLKDDAQWLYHWADEWILKSDTEVAAYGTPIIVFGNYPFDLKTWNVEIASGMIRKIPQNKLVQEINKYIDLINERQKQRQAILTKTEPVFP